MDISPIQQTTPDEPSYATLVWCFDQDLALTTNFVGLDVASCHRAAKPSRVTKGKYSADFLILDKHCVKEIDHF